MSRVLPPLLHVHSAARCGLPNLDHLRYLLLCQHAAGRVPQQGMPPVGGHPQAEHEPAGRPVRGLLRLRVRQLGRRSPPAGEPHRQQLVPGAPAEDLPQHSVPAGAKRQPDGPEAGGASEDHVSGLFEL
uniref:(northern house mosquito) hypothetical protein n=1 Tax=Culex pipiens TaxID=7175 RepID=A0A8D8A0L8_CULPI